MFFRHLLSISIIGLICLLSLGNKNGRASSQNKGNTGAPGDEVSLGHPKTCQNCHNQGPITATLAITVLDAANQAVTQYHPGQVYTASVKISASGTGLQGYGFQMIALRDAGNTDLDGFGDVNPNNYKIATISNGRTYAEHDNISSSNTFNVKWTAPAAGTGAVTFYASGNGVNANGGTSGDGAAVNSLKLSEFGTVAAEEAESPQSFLKISPDPAYGNSFLDTQGFPAGDYRIRAFDSRGNIQWQTAARLPATGSPTEIPSDAWQAGVYYIQVEGDARRAIVKVLKL